MSRRNADDRPVVGRGSLSQASVRIRYVTKNGATMKSRKTFFQRPAAEGDPVDERIAISECEQRRDARRTRTTARTGRGRSRGRPSSSCKAQVERVARARTSRSRATGSRGSRAARGRRSQSQSRPGSEEQVGRQPPVDDGRCSRRSALAQAPSNLLPLLDVVSLLSAAESNWCSLRQRRVGGNTSGFFASSGSIFASASCVPLTGGRRRRRRPRSGPRSSGRRRSS